MELSSILPTISVVKSVVNELKQQHKKVILTQGSWDMIHIGHARYLHKAKSMGDVLIVGVDSDEKIKFRKGPDRPIVPQDERMEMLQHIRYVDYVFLKNVDDPKWNLIKAICPDVLVITKRQTYTKEQLKELKNYCKEIIVLQSQATTSTSAKIRLMQLHTAKRLKNLLTPKLIKAISETLHEIKSQK